MVMHGRSGGGTHLESVDGLENLPSSKVTSVFLQAVSDRPKTSLFRPLFMNNNLFKTLLGLHGGSAAVPRSGTRNENRRELAAA